MTNEVDYHKEFRLTSSKCLIRFEDASSEETALWIDHLAKEGFILHDPREIFEPFWGEERTYLNEDVGTNELRVRRWKWICGGNNKNEEENEAYELVDMNAWPGDNESGVITLDSKLLLENSDTNLQFRENCDHADFALRLPFFSALRTSLHQGENYIDFNVVGIRAFRESKHGKEAMEIERQSCRLSNARREVITNEHEQLKNLHQHEFTFLYAKFDGTQKKMRGGWGGGITRITSTENVAAQIGYIPKVGFEGKMADHIDYRFFKWIYQEKVYILVTVNDHYHVETYLLNDTGKIESLVFDSNYLAKDDGKRTDLILALHPRVHAFIEIRNKSH